MWSKNMSTITFDTLQLESQLVTKRDLQETESRIIHELTLRIGTMIVAIAGLVIGIIEITK
jgi:hypothetical protein